MGPTDEYGADNARDDARKGFIEVGVGTDEKSDEKGKQGSSPRQSHASKSSIEA